MRKTILIFIWYFMPPGGAENFTQEIVKRVCSDYDFEIITARCEKNLPKKHNINGAVVHRVGTGYFWIDKFLFPVFGFFKARKINRKKNVVLSHGIIANLAGLTAMLFARVSRKPFLLTEQSGNLDTTMKAMGWPVLWLYKRIYRKADFIQVISSSLKKKILGLGKVEPDKIHVVPNGINLDLFFGQSQVEKKPFRIVCVARLEPYKGVEYLVKAMPEILEKFPQAELCLIGDGPERSKLEKIAKELKITDKVIFRGELNKKEIPAELKRASVFVGPSLDEGMGIVFIEARASGLPVIGTRVGGITDVIENNVNGILVEPKNSKAIAEAVVKVFSNPDFSNTLTRNAQIGLEKYSWHTIAQQILKLYSRLSEGGLPSSKSAEGRPPQQRKIVIAGTIFPPEIGGPATYAKNLQTELLKQGFRAPVVCFLKSLPVGIRHSWYFLELLKIARGSKVIYAQDTISSGFPALLASRILRKKFVIRIVGDWAWERFESHKAQGDSLEDFQNKKYGVKVKIAKSLQKFVAKRAHKIITPSNYLKNIIVGWGVEEQKISVIHNALKPLPRGLEFSKQEAKQRSGLKGDVILSVGRLILLKGFDFLIKIFPDILAINSDFKLVIVGEGPAKNNLEKLIKKFGLEGKVILAGKKQRQELGLYYKLADMFILNSQHDTFPHVLLEAMQARLPVIASRVGGIPEIIEHNKNGILFEHNNKDQILQAISTLHNNKALADQFTHASSQKLLQFDFNNIIKQTINLLNNL